jgi:vitamin B12 transporter
MTKTKLSLLLAVAISANASNINLEKLTVTTPTKSSQSLQNVTANVDIITADEIKQRGYKTIKDALKSHAGILSNTNGGLGKQTSIMVRGFDSKRVLVLVDGVRYNNPTSISGAEFQHILLENVEQIEIVKGAQSGVWGADASAGVINIITKKATKEGVTASVFGEYGSFNTQNMGFNTGYKQGKFDVSLNAQRVTSDGFSSKTPVGKKATDFEDDSYENNSADIKLGYDVTQNDRVETFFNYIDSDSDFDGYNKDAVKAANDLTSNGTSKELFYGINYTKTEAKNKTKLYFNHSDFSRVSKSGKRKSEFDGAINEFGLNSEVAYRKDASLSIGLDCKKFKHENKIDKEYANQGIFVTNSNKFNDVGFGDLIFSQALRYDKFDDFKNKVTYKIGARVNLQKVEDLWFLANYATAYNVPSLFQLYSYAGNKNLNPEETKGFDITANYKGFGVTYFQNDIDDMIEYKTTDFETFAGSYFNVAGKSTLKGVEVDYSGSFKELGYNLNYTYLDTEDRDGKELPRRAKNSANLSLDYYGVANTHVGTLIQYVGERKKSKYDKNPKVDYDSYTLVDLIADYDVNEKLNLYAKVDNVLDEEYQEITGYGTSERAFYLGFRYKIK